MMSFGFFCDVHGITAMDPLNNSHRAITVFAPVTEPFAVFAPILADVALGPGLVTTGYVVGV